MGLSRSKKILILLVIDVVFFLVELIVGIYVHSLALVADSFHMLNDVISLLVALYAIKLAKSYAPANFSYGWHRAEILGALVNGVFLLALCFSIFLEAIERFFSHPDVSNPKLVVIVGSVGLAFNILGLLLFHEHSHSHSHGDSHSHSHKKDSRAVANKPSSSATPTASTPTAVPTPPRHRAESIASLYEHPAQRRASLVQAAVDIGYGRSGSVTHSPTLKRTSWEEQDLSEEPPVADHLTDLEANVGTADSSKGENGQPPVNALHYADHGHSHSHDDHEAAAAAPSSGGGHGHGHSHGSGSMNMRGVLIHVMGDALGNVGVIATGLIIWLTKWDGRFYMDPTISLIITAIIFSSALPLVKSTSYILLQRVPEHVRLEELRTEIQSVPGVISIHELHVWQLSESKSIASVHVYVGKDTDYMGVAADIRRVLHEFGVHSSTIQPEVHLGAGDGSDIRLIDTSDTTCLIQCPPGAACPPENACCPPNARLIDVDP